LKVTFLRSIQLALKKESPNFLKFGLSSIFLFFSFLQATEFNFFQKDLNFQNTLSNNHFSFKYERLPEPEIKSFLSPPLTLNQPKLEIVQQPAELSYFTPFLYEERSIFPLSRKANRVFFITKFSPSIYQISNLEEVRTLKRNEKTPSFFVELSKQHFLTFPISLTKCEVKEIFLPNTFSQSIKNQTLNFNHFAYTKIDSLLTPKHKNSISKNLSLKTLAIQSQTLAQPLKPTKKFKQSLKKESSFISLAPLTQIDLLVECSDLLAKLYTPNWKIKSAEGLHYICRANINFEKTSLNSSFAIQMPKPLQNSFKVTRPVQKKLSPTQIASNFSFSSQFPNESLSLHFENDKLYRNFLSTVYSKETFSYTFPSYFGPKKTLTSTSFLFLPRPLLQMEKTLFSLQETKLKPKKSFHAAISYSSKEPTLDLETKNKTYPVFKLQQAFCSLTNIKSVETEKPLLLASNCFWKPSNSSKVLTLKKEKTAITKYSSQNEIISLKPLMSNQGIEVCLKHSTSLNKNSYFALNESRAIGFTGSSITVFDKNFSHPHFSKDLFHELVKLYPIEKKSYEGNLFDYHDALVKVFNTKEEPKQYISLIKPSSNLIFPSNMKGEITLTKSFALVDEKLEDVIIRLGPKIQSKEAIFPQKQFLQTTSYLSETEILKSFEPTLSYTSIHPDLVECLIPGKRSEISPSLISLSKFSTTFSPQMDPSETNILLSQTREISSFSFTLHEALSINRASRQILHHMGDMPSLEELQTYSLSDDFKIDVHILQKPDRTGYAFSLQLLPYDHECIEPIKNHVYFILDRSSSIESHRFSSFKNGIIQSLAQLHESSSFNIFTFDQNYDRISQTDLRPSKSSINYVKKQLDRLCQKWSSSFVTLLTLLEEIKKEAEKTDEPYTVIILSNGQFLKNLRFNKDALLQLFHQNNSNFTICTAAISDNNNTFMLDLLAKLGRGEFIYSQTHSAFPRKLAVMTKRLQRPLATDISVSLATSNEKATFSHFSQTAPLLFADKLYHIYGQTEKLQDLHLVIQGKSGEKWINIVKKIDLKKAEKNKEIAKEISSKEALAHIMNYIFTSDQSELAAARALIAPFDIKWSL
jgi:hypothetical protein